LSYFIGIDIGTSSVKTVLASKTGEVIDIAQNRLEVSYPHEGWAEQDPREWWQGVKRCLHELISRNSVDTSSIKGIGLSGQMHGLVMLDEKNDVLAPSILWCDQRTIEECRYLNEEIGHDIIAGHTGNIALPGFTAPKVLWIRKNRPDLFRKITHILLPKDYIVFRLTGKYATDVSDASGTLYFDVRERKWSQSMLEILEILPDQLPEVHESWEPVGTISEEASRETLLCRDTVVVAGAGDQAAGAVGTGAVDEGVLSVALGTSGVVFVSSNSFVMDRGNRLHSFCHANGKWHQMGVMLSAASCLKWWTEEIHCDLKSYEYDTLLEEVHRLYAAGKSNVLFLPYLLGERTPYTDPHARGCFVGLGMSHRRGHMTRAILEGVAFGLRDSLEILRDLGIRSKVMRLSGGGSESAVWRQIIADVFDMRVDTVNTKEGPAYGGAILAMVGCGCYGSVTEACDTMITVTGSCIPAEDNIGHYDSLYGIYKGMYGVLKDSFHLLASTK